MGFWYVHKTSICALLAQQKGISHLHVATSCCKATRAREGAEGDEDTPTVAAGDLAAKRLGKPKPSELPGPKKVFH